MPRAHRKSKGSRRSRRNKSIIETLERRRLLTSMTVNGTSGDDVIQVDYHGVGGITGIVYDFTVNGVTTSKTVSGFGGNVVTVNALGGGDSIQIKRVFTDDTVTVNPGAGTDEIDVGVGSLDRNIKGTVTITQQPNEGNDGLFVDDSGGGSNSPIEVSSTAIAVAQARVIHGGALSAILLKVASDPLETHEVYVDQSVPNMTIDMGGVSGGNILTFSPHDHVLDSSAIPMTIIGANWVRFDDAEGASGRPFDITPTSFFGKTLVDCQSVSFFPNGNVFPNLYTFNVTGNPVDFLTLESCSGDVNFGDSDAPTDVASFSGFFLSKVRGTTYIYDSALTNPGSHFLLDTQGGSPGHQNIRKGNFNLTIQDAAIDLQIVERGSSNTVFDIADLEAHSNVRLFGGAGDDTLQTVNTPSTSHQFDLDNVFVGESCFFNGGGGNNLLDLNDSNGNTQFGNPQYELSPGVLGESLGGLKKNGVELLDYFGLNATRINWAGSSDNDQVFFAGTPGSRVTLNGGAGNDLFSTFDPDLGGGNLPLEGVGGLIVGGTGLDAITIDDTAGSGATEFEVFDANVNYRVGNQLSAISYNTIESIQLFEGSGSAKTGLYWKTPSVQLLVDAGAGNDSVVAGGGDIDDNGWRFTTIVGGAGVDDITFEDSADAPNNFGSNFEDETYTLENQSLRKGSFGFGYSEFESQVIYAGNGESDVFGVNNIFNINIIPAGLPTTIIGDVLRFSTINVAASSHDLDSILSPLTLLLGPLPGSEVTVNDQNETATMNYTLTSTQFTRTVPPPGSGTKTINFSGVGSLVLNESQGGNKKLVVSGTPAGMATTINANFSASAFNSFTLGGGNVSANLLGPITVNGSGGASNGVVFDNSLDTDGSTQTLNGGIFTDGRTHTMNNVSSMFIQNGGGGGTMNIPRVTIPTSVNGGAQILTIGGGNLDANLLAGVTVDGASSVTVDDRLDTGNDGYLIDAQSFRKTSAGAPAVTIGLHDAAILQCNNADNVITVNNCSTGVQVFGNGGNDRFDVLNTKPNFFAPVNTLGIDTGAENSSVSPFGDTVNVSGNSSVQLLNNDAIRNLSVSGSGAKFIIPTGVTCKVQALTISGVIDMAGGALLSTTGGPSQATIRTLITRGYNNGGWNGTNPAGAINSSLAASSPINDSVGYALGSEIGLASIGGFSIAPADTLLRYTLAGDTDLSGGVGLTDFTFLAAHFNQTGQSWLHGDANYDGNVDLTDFTLLASNFNQTLPGSPLLVASADTHQEERPIAQIEGSS